MASLNVDDDYFLDIGDELELNLEKGLIKNLTTGDEFKIKKMPKFLQDIISVKGLVNFARKRILKNT